jgi:hypothetical protein
VTEIRCSEPRCTSSGTFELDDPGDGDPYSFTLSDGWRVEKNQDLIGDVFEFRCERHKRED